MLQLLPFSKLKLGAILLAIKWAIHNHYNVVYLYSDCLNAILQIRSCSDGHFADKSLLQTLSDDLSQLSFCRISKVDKIAVQSAHQLAKDALETFVHCPNPGFQMENQRRNLAFLAHPTKPPRCCFVSCYVFILFCFVLLIMYLTLINVVLPFPQKKKKNPHFNIRFCT